MKKIVLIAAMILGSSGGLFGSLGTADAQTAGFTAYVDSVSDLGVGALQTTTTIASGGTATVEIEVQNIPAPGLNGYNVTITWAPASGLTLTPASINITDRTGLPNQIVKSAGVGTATVSFTDLADPLCTANAGAGPTSSVLFSATFTGVGANTNVITIDPTLSGVVLCDTAEPPIAAFDTGDVVVTGGSTATPTNTPAATVTPTRTPCASGCPTAPPPPANYKSVTPTPSPTSAATAAPGAPPAPVATTPGGGTGAGGATPRAGLVGPDTGSGGGGGSGFGLLSMIAALTGLVAAAAGATYYGRRRAGA